jgi:predicted  nucleic acid-binding Zn-ribbon protein
MIATLTQENEALKSQKAQWEAAQQRLTKLQDDTSNLKTENAGLQIKLDSAQSELKVLEEQLSAFKIQMGQEIVRANQAIETLKKENATLMAAPKIDPDEGLRREFEALKAEYAELKKKCEAQQYELIKARAQTSGLERVNFNYKNQLEELLKKV